MAQVAIDNANRQFNIDLNKEIELIENDMEIKTNGYPKFWKHVKDKKAKIGQPKFKSEKINKHLVCPMNKLLETKFEDSRSDESTLPMSYFFQKFELSDNNRVKSKKVESLIEEYSLCLYQSTQEEDDDEYFLMRGDFDELLSKISSMYISRNYIGLMSWLIDRAFCISSDIKRNTNTKKSKTDNNKSILLKVLYDINAQNILDIFGKNVQK